jgi:ribonuclease G
MSNRKIVVDTSPGETRVAILSNGRLDEVLIERMGQARLIGSIVSAPVTAVRPTLGAVFLNLGACDGYLDRFSSALPNQGETLVVQVIAEAHRAKAARVTSDISLNGRFLTITPTRPGHAIARAITAKGERRRLRTILSRVVPEEIGALVHANASECEADSIEADGMALMDRWTKIQEARDNAATATFKVLEAAPSLQNEAQSIAPEASVHVGRDGALFREHDIDSQISVATERRVDLASGAALIIDETEAFVAIDVDVARATGDSPNAFASEIAQELSRQIRLRRLAGLILIDYPRGGPKDARQAFVKAIENALARDPNQPTIHGWTRGGLLELTRSRRGPSLSEIMRTKDRTAPFNATTRALEALRRVLRETSGIARPRLICPNSIKLALQGPLRPALDEVERRLGGHLTLDAGTGINEIEITGD